MGPSYQRTYSRPSIYNYPSPQKQSSGIGNQLARAGGGLLGMYAGTKIINPALEKVMDKMPSFDSIFSAGSAPQAPSVISATNGVAPSVPNVITGSQGGGMLSGIGSYALPAAGAALGAYGLYDTFTGDKSKAGGALQGAASGAALGASVGSVFPVVGTAVGAGVGGLLGGVGGLLAGQDKPHPETLDRRTQLDELKGQGITDGLNIGNARDPKTYNVDLSKAGTDQPLGQMIGAVNPLAEILVADSQGQYNNADSDKRRSDTTGMLTNALMQDGSGGYEKLRSMYASKGLDHDTAYARIVNMASGPNAQITEQERDAYLAALDNLYAHGDPTKAKGASQEDIARAQASRALMRGEQADMTPWRAPVVTQPAPMPQQIPQMPIPQKAPAPAPSIYGQLPQEIRGMQDRMRESIYAQSPANEAALRPASPAFIGGKYVAPR